MAFPVSSPASCVTQINPLKCCKEMLNLIIWSQTLLGQFRKMDCHPSLLMHFVLHLELRYLLSMLDPPTVAPLVRCQQYFLLLSLLVILSPLLFQ